MFSKLLQAFSERRDISPMELQEFLPWQDLKTECVTSELSNSHSLSSLYSSLGVQCDESLALFVMKLDITEILSSGLLHLSIRSSSWQIIFESKFAGTQWYLTSMFFLGQKIKYENYK